jgi:hypothetical protein
MNFMLAPYFTVQPDPQSDERVFLPDDDELIGPWLSDVRRLELNACIFFDELSESFRRRHESERVRFVHSVPPSHISCNDYRFVAFRNWLYEHPEADIVFCTDLFDVRIKKDPAGFVRDRRTVYAGNEPCRIGRSGFMINKLRRAYARRPYLLKFRRILNAGILGGARAPLLSCLETLAHDLVEANVRIPRGNHNMGVFNHVLYKTIKSRRLWAKGAPLHSVFKAYDTQADVVFVHK